MLIFHEIQEHLQQNQMIYFVVLSMTTLTNGCRLWMREELLDTCLLIM